MPADRRILVVCMGDAVSGGPEVLHQLVHQLRLLGRRAFMCYLPFDRPFEQPEPFRKYNAPQCRFDYVSGDLVILPETLTKLSSAIHSSDCAIWWLSVDNYFGFPQDHVYSNPFAVISGNRWFDSFRKLRSLVRHRRPLRALREMVHYAQSGYAREFLARDGIRADMLTDYLSEEHLIQLVDREKKRDIIAYNPKKGIEITRQLMRQLPSLSFVAMQDMTPAQVSELLRASKIYIDFGHHPGKDRLPREAAVAGCCVITGNAGAAAFPEDVPIPHAYHLDPYEEGFTRRFEQIVRDIFREFEVKSRDFDDWRRIIRNERRCFELQVQRLFTDDDRPRLASAVQATQQVMQDPGGAELQHEAPAARPVSFVGGKSEETFHHAREWAKYRAH